MGEWILLKNKVLEETIPLFEFDEGGHITDTNQEAINETMKDMMNQIKEGDVILSNLYPVEVFDDNDEEPPDSESLYIPKGNKYIIKLKGVIKTRNEEFPL